MTEREHNWQLITHVDGCHYYITVVECDDCGTTLRRFAERDPNADEMALVWFKDNCERCRELQSGAKPHSETEVNVP